MKRVFLVSYASERFKRVERDLHESARAYGIENIISYCEYDLYASDYYLQNKSILDEECGGGLWAWKPYFILSALSRLEDGEILLYCDAGSLIVESPSPLIDLAAKQAKGIVLFDARPLKCRQFAKRDSFVRMNCDKPKYWNANKIIATILLVRKSKTAVQFLEEWLHYCQDRATISHDLNTCGLDSFPDFIQHRWDQSILNILATKYKLETYRNPTLWGNFLKLPAFRVPGEQVLSPYNLIQGICTYSRSPQRNSRYGTIFAINRKPNFIGKPSMPIANLGQDNIEHVEGSFLQRLSLLILPILRTFVPSKIRAKLKQTIFIMRG